MPADAKEILDAAVDRRDALEVRDRCKAAHLALAVAGRLMRHVDAMVRIRGGAVQDRRDQGTAGGVIARQLVGDQAARDGALCVQGVWISLGLRAKGHDLLTISACEVRPKPGQPVALVEGA